MGSVMTAIQPLEHIMEELEQAEGLDALQAATEALCDHYAIDHVVYHWVDSVGGQYGCGTYSDTWRARYLDLKGTSIFDHFRGRAAVRLA